MALDPLSWLRKFLGIAGHQTPELSADELARLPLTHPLIVPPPPSIEAEDAPALVRAGDDAARLVYADELEERGRTLESQWLRLELQHWVAPVSAQQELTAQLRAIEVSVAFKAAVARPDVENCDKSMCRSHWGSLSLTKRFDVRRCEACAADVHFAPSLNRAQTLTAERKRVAVSPEIDYSKDDLSRAPGMPWPLFVANHPRWSDASQTCAPYRGKALPPVRLEQHPLFSAWHDEITDAPVRVDLDIGKSRVEPREGDCFAEGNVAFLDQPRWPTCANCKRDLRFCLQLSAATMADWLGSELSLVLMYCFECRTDEPGTSFARALRPLHRVVCRERIDEPPAEWAPTRWRLEPARQVKPRTPIRDVPSSVWFRTRAVVVDDTASSALFGYDAIDIDGPFPGGERWPRGDREDKDLADWDDWAQSRGGGDFLGGVAHWDQDDATSRCPHGEMLHLLDYNGGQFLDGALHVFVCRANTCAIRCVAEF